MKIEFNDEILKGEIVIDRPLTIFTGRNGTGKTYAAKKLIGENFYYFGLKAQEISNGYWYPTDSGDFFDLAKQIETELFDPTVIDCPPVPVIIYLITSSGWVIPFGAVG